MSKYRSRETPVPGSSISETHPGYWADCIKWERNIRNRWHIDYGHHFYGKKPDPSPTGIEPHERWVHGHGAAEKGLQKTHGCISGPRWPPKGPIPQVTSDIADPDERSALTAPIGWYNYDDQSAEGNVKEYKQAIVQGNEVKAPEMVYDYPTPGNTQKHHVVKDHVTAYSSSFGHHSKQFRNQNQMHSGSSKTAPSDNYFYLRPRSSKHNDSAPDTKEHHDRDKSKRRPGDKSDGISDILEGLLKPDGRVDLDKLSLKTAGCTWDEFQNWRKSLPGPEVCPKCENRLGCTCVPRRREKIPEDPGTSPDEELPPWPPQVWCGPTYNGARCGSLGDILRLRYRLSRDPELKTPMNRMYDEMKAVNYYGKGQHAGEDSFSCGVCRTAREAGRGTWFDEQLRKGNPFTTGDTQFKSSMYSQKP